MWLRQFGACPWSIVCRPYVVYRQHLRRPVFAVWISTRNSRTDQKLSKWLRRQQLNWRHEVQSETQQCVKWLETLGEHVSVVDANAGVFMHWRSFVFVVSLFFVIECRCPLTVFLDRCTHTVAQVWVFVHTIVILMFHSHGEWSLRPLHLLYLLPLHLSYLLALLAALHLLLPWCRG